MKKFVLLIAASCAMQAHAFGVQSNVSVNIGSAETNTSEPTRQNHSGPVGFGLDIARDAVGAGLSIARGATDASLHTAQAITEASLQTAGSIVGTLTRSDRRALRQYCAQKPLSRRQQARFENLPEDWEDDVQKSQPLPDNVEDYAIVISAKQAGIRNRQSQAVLLRVENKLILVDSRTDIVIDVMAL